MKNTGSGWFLKFKKVPAWKRKIPVSKTSGLICAIDYRGFRCHQKHHHRHPNEKQPNRQNNKVARF
jgi:hypothetical protein